MTREKIQEILNIVMDIQMSIDAKERAGEGFNYVNYADGTKISLPISEEIKEQIDEKITDLILKLKDKVAKSK